MKGITLALFSVSFLLASSLIHSADKHNQFWKLKIMRMNWKTACRGFTNDLSSYCGKTPKLFEKRDISPDGSNRSSRRRRSPFYEVKATLKLFNGLDCHLEGRRIQVTNYCRKEIFTQFDCTDQVGKRDRMRHRLRIARAYDDNGNLFSSSTTYRLGSGEGLWMRWGVKNILPAADQRTERLEDASASNVSDSERTGFAVQWERFTDRLADAYTLQLNQYRKERNDRGIREIKELFGPGAVSLLGGEPASDQQCDDLLVSK